MLGLIILKVLIAYLLGSLSGSLLLGQWRGVDIRQQGSGNAGGTNALRTQGVGFALAVVAIDIGKGVLACALVANAVFLFSQPLQIWVTVACGLAAVMGHIWPVYFRFRGGKGAATVVGVMLVIAPFAGLWVLLLWLLVLGLTGYVGLATISAAASLPLVLSVSSAGTPLVVFGVCIALVVVWAHRSNIQRMCNGTENRFEKARLLYWLNR